MVINFKTEYLMNMDDDIFISLKNLKNTQKTIRKFARENHLLLLD